MTATFQHSDLGEVKGEAVDGAVQFLGLKYASLENRFSPPQLHTNYGSGVVNASKFGPPPVSPLGAVNAEQSFIQHSLPLPEVPDQSDTECLNLNITVPLGKDGKIQSDGKLPVYVFIHGGGFQVGSSWFPHYNPVSLVRMSVEKGKPIIGITINYRLGAAGFLTSAELRNAGYKANNGLRDQRTALQWIKKYISGFGGDPEEITVGGESAGGLSSMMLLYSNEPFMKRCFSTGGSPLLFKPLPEFLTEMAYGKVIEAFGLKEKSPEERIKALLTVPINELWQKVPPGTPLMPALDGDVILGAPTFKSVSQADDPSLPMPGRKWCSSVMIGDSTLDGNILAYTVLDSQGGDVAKRFIASANKTLSSNPQVASQLLDAYSITPTTPDDQALLSIILFASEILFYASGRACALGWPCTPENKIFLYHFNEGNPWEGRFKGEAGHILDVAYLFQNYNEFLNEEQKAVAKKFGEDFLEFVNGGEPWQAVQREKFHARVYGPSGKGVSTKFVDGGKPEDVGRTDRVFKLGEVVGMDTVADVFQNFFQGR